LTPGSIDSLVEDLLQHMCASGLYSLVVLLLGPRDLETVLLVELDPVIVAGLHVEVQDLAVLVLFTLLQNMFQQQGAWKSGGGGRLRKGNM